MKMLPDTKDSPVIRTDFENQSAWETICDLIRAPVRVFGQDLFAYVEVEFVEDTEFRDLSTEELMRRAPMGDEYGASCLLVVDKIATRHPEFPILVVDLWDERGRTFRTIPSEILGIECNLSLSNMDFRDFANSTDQDGVFRGFRRP
jgi:hypothetical protein